MKRFIAIFAIVFISIISFGKTKEQAKMEKEITKDLTGVSFAHFKKYETVTLQMEVDKWTKMVGFFQGWDKSFLDAFIEGTNTENMGYPRSYFEKKAGEYRDNLSKHTALLEHLAAVKRTYNCNKTTFTIYQLTYIGTDQDGNKVHNHCYGRFNSSGEMVAFRLNDSTDWKLKGNFWSIPDIEKDWNIPAKWRRDIININF